MTVEVVFVNKMLELRSYRRFLKAKKREMRVIIQEL